MFKKILKVAGAVIFTGVCGLLAHTRGGLWYEGVLFGLFFWLIGADILRRLKEMIK